MDFGNVPLPVPTVLTAPFWEAANEGRLVLQRCRNCGTFLWTPQVFCVGCFSDALVWETVSGTGSIYSFTIVHRAPLPAFGTPYVLAVVDLAEGPLMLTRLIECDPAEVRMGASVQVSFTRATAAINLYTFRLAG